MSLRIREESSADIEKIDQIVQKAFPSPAEAQLVLQLRQQGLLRAGYVLEYGGELVGYIAYSPMDWSGEKAWGLAPVAVLAKYQRQGLGSQLIEYSLQQLKEAQVDAVFVLGDPAYYSRFGFETAANYQLSCEYQVPREAFMVQALRPGCLEGVSGLARYCPPFAKL